jgi:NAD(P)-dependent dehydrogenase (short-subunit alcohol dehydrogenase family)
MPSTILITGASGGIGAALAEHLTARGDMVAVVARRREALLEVVGRCHERAIGIVGDMTDRDAVRRAIDETLGHFGELDVLVNNVGRGITRKPSELSDDDIDEMMRVNVKSALYGMQESLPYFRERGRGHVINVSSMLARIPSAIIRSAYSASKHYLNALTTNFRMEIQYKHPGIQYSLVMPGVVATEFGVNAMHGGPDSRTLPSPQAADEVAHIIAQVIDSRVGEAYTRPEHEQAVAAYYASVVSTASLQQR